MSARFDTVITMGYIRLRSQLPASIRVPPSTSVSPPVSSISGWQILAGAAVIVGAIAAIRELTLSKRERHDRVVKRTAKDMLDDGYAVAADIPGWPRPPITNSRRADVYGVRGRSVQLVEVEHDDTLDTWHTREQIADLDAARPGGR